MICPVCELSNIKELKNVGFGYLDIYHLNNIECRCTVEEWQYINATDDFNVRAWKDELLQLIATSHGLVYTHIREKIEELIE